MATGICAARREERELEPNAAALQSRHPALSGRGACRRSTSFPACSSAWAVAIGTMPPCLPRRSKPAAAWSVVVKFGPGSKVDSSGSPDVATAMTQDITTSLLQMGVDRRLPRRSGRSADRRPYRAYGNASSKISTANEDGRTRTKAGGVGGTLTGNNGFMWMARRRPCGTRTPSIRPRSAGSWPRASRLRLCVQRGNGQRMALTERWSLTPRSSYGRRCLSGAFAMSGMPTYPCAMATA